MRIGPVLCLAAQLSLSACAGQSAKSVAPPQPNDTLEIRLPQQEATRAPGVDVTAPQAQQIWIPAKQDGKRFDHWRSKVPLRFDRRLSPEEHRWLIARHRARSGLGFSAGVGIFGGLSMAAVGWTFGVAGSDEGCGGEDYAPCFDIFSIATITGFAMLGGGIAGTIIYRRRLKRLRNATPPRMRFSVDRGGLALRF